jgi:hypothetical protein
VRRRSKERWALKVTSTDSGRQSAGSADDERKLDIEARASGARNGGGGYKDRRRRFRSKLAGSGRALSDARLLFCQVRLYAAAFRAVLLDIVRRTSPSSSSGATGLMQDRMPSPWTDMAHAARRSLERAVEQVRLTRHSGATLRATPRARQARAVRNPSSGRQRRKSGCEVDCT